LETALLLTTILKMSLMIGIGLVLSRFVPLNGDIKKFLIFVLVNVALPCLILNGIIQLTIDSELMLQLFSVIGLSLFLHIAGVFIVWLAAKFIKAEASKAREISILSIVGNTGIIGIPLCATLFGPKGALFASVFDVGMAFTLWTVAVMVLSKDRTFKFSNLKSALNMPMLSVVVGLILAVAGLNTSEFLKDFTGTVAKMTSPLAMIYIGLLISSTWHTIKKSFSLHLIAPIFGKLVFFPVLALILTMMIGVPKGMAEVIIVEAAMPMATTVAIVFARSNADETFALISTLVSTVVSMLTIPLVIYTGRLFLFG
jgi:hypothetical protein